MSGGSFGGVLRRLAWGVSARARSPNGVVSQSLGSIRFAELGLGREVTPAPHDVPETNRKVPRCPTRTARDLNMRTRSVTHCADCTGVRPNPSSVKQIPAKIAQSVYAMSSKLSGTRLTQFWGCNQGLARSCEIWSMSPQISWFLARRRALPPSVEGDESVERLHRREISRDSFQPGVVVRRRSRSAQTTLCIWAPCPAGTKTKHIRSIANHARLRTLNS